MNLCKRLLAGLLAAAAALSMTACGASSGDGSSAGSKTASASQTAQTRTDLNMALSVDPDGLDPQRTTAASTFQITNNIYDTLLRVNTDGTLKEGLAESWETSEDGLTLTFRLRSGVTFHNGNPCNAEAVVSSFERLQAEDSPRAADYANFTFTAQGEDTVVVTCAELDVAALSSFAYPWSAIVDTSVTDTLKNSPVGTGPYKLKEWVPQQSLTLEKNPDYYDTVNLETITFKMMPDATSQIASLRSGELDIISVSGDQVAAFENDPQFNIVQAPSNGIQLMAMNLANEALSDVRVRQAINYAVDKQSLIDTVWWGYGEPIGSHYPTVLKEYVDLNDTYSYDPEKAKELLAQAGYADGLTLEMYLPKSYPAYVSAGQVIADSLKEVGITCNITIVEWAAWLSDVYNGRNYDLTVVGHTGRLDPYVLLARYQSDSSENYFNYSNPEVDELLSGYKSEKDEAKRTEMVQQVEQILAEDVPAYYIQTPITLYVTSSAVEGFEIYPIDIYEMKDVSFAS